MNIISWAIFGLLAGLASNMLAQHVLKIGHPGGMIKTMFLGIIGSWVGGFICSMLGKKIETNTWSWPHFWSAVGGSILILLIYHML